jgi:hypothetical protein
MDNELGRMRMEVIVAENKILSRIWVIVDKVWIDSGFIEHLQNVSRRNYNSLANLHTLQLTITRTKSSRSGVSLPVVAW